MEIRVLGPVAVVDGDAHVPLGGPRQQSVLAVLVALAGETVSTDRLIDEIWGEEPPPAAKNSLQSMVSNLRGIVSGDGEITIDRAGPGYVLRCPDDRIDARVFGAAVDRARSHLGEDPGASESALSGALDMWKGAAYAGVSDDIPVLQADRIRLEELRVRAIGYRLEASIGLGRHGEVVGELDTLVAAYPLNEEFARLQMLALYRSGRQSEALRAMSRLRRTLGDELGIDPSPDLRALEQRILDQDPSLGTVGDPGARRSDLLNPYKGLRSFGEADAHNFFGRDAMAVEIVDRIDSAGPGGFTALVGASGSGKSSLVSAGVVPRLRSGAIEGSDSWVVCSMYPGSRPMEELEASVVSAVPDASGAIIELLNGEDGLRRVARLLTGDDGQLLLVVDQAEELFTLANADQRERFIDAMTGALDDERARVRVVFTLRADYLSAPLADPRLADLLRAGTLLVAPMSAAELEEAIVGPAERAGASVDPGLVAAALSEVQGHPGALPMLQHALTETFERRASDRLTREDYVAVGGVATALSNTADRVLDALGDSRRSAVRLGLLRLVTPGEASADTRRRVLLSELRDVDIESDELERILDAFATARLLVFDVDQATGKATVEVAHEALLQEWPVYRAWIDQARDDLRTEQRLRVLVADWEANARHDEFLLRGSNLARYIGWRDETSIPLDSSSAEFLDAGLEAEEAAARTTARRRRRVVVSLSAATIVSIVLAVLAGILSARSAREARVAEARSLANESGALIVEDPDLALLLALEAAALEPLPDVLEAVHRGVRNQRLLAVLPAEAASATWLDEERIATLRGDGTIEVYRASDGVSEARFGPVSAPLTLDRNGDSPILTVSSDASLIAAGFADGTVEVWDVESGARLWSVQLGENLPTISWRPSRLQVAVKGREGATSSGFIYDGRTGEVHGRIGECVCPAEITFDETGRLWFQGGGGTAASALLIGQSEPDESGQIEPAELLRFPGLDEVAATRFVVVATADSLAQAQTTDGTVLSVFAQHSSIIRDIDVGPRRLVISGGDDGQARVWSADTGRQLHLLAGHEGVVTGVQFAPGFGGDRALTTGTDGTARIWDVTVDGTAEIDAFPLEGRGALFGAFVGDGRYVVGASDLDVYNWGRLLVLRGLVPATIEFVGAGLTPQTLAFESIFAADAETGRVAVGQALFPTPEIALVGGAWPGDSPVLSWGPPTALSLEGSFMLVGGCSAVSRPLTRLFLRNEPGECLGNGYVARVPLIDGAADLEAAASVFVGPVTPIAVSTFGESVVALVVDDPVTSARASVWFWTPVDAGAPVSWPVPADATAMAVGGDRILVGFGSGDLRFYDGSGELIRLHSAHTGGVAGIRVDASVGLVFTAGADGRVRLWDLTSGEERYTLFEGPGRILSIDVNPEAREVLAAEEGGVLWVLTYDPDRIIAIAQERVTRSLTDEECERYLRRACDA